jgi:hypothetical protein
VKVETCILRKEYPSINQADLRIRCVASATSRCRACNWLKQLAHAAG